MHATLSRYLITHSDNRGARENTGLTASSPSQFSWWLGFQSLGLHFTKLFNTFCG